MQVINNATAIEAKLHRPCIAVNLRRVNAMLLPALNAKPKKSTQNSKNPTRTGINCYHP
jgi:hypothetical protein